MWGWTGPWSLEVRTQTIMAVSIHSESLEDDAGTGTRQPRNRSLASHPASLFWPRRPASRALPATSLLSLIVMADSADKCPVDHRALASSSSAEKCPVDHTQRSSWTSILSSQSQGGHDAAELPDTPLPPPNLPLERETSSIPRVDGENWVYPSQAQFYAAMARKNHNPRESDMKVVVPIHNAVNERAWGEIMKWETGQGGDKCGGVKLGSFKGRPNDRSPRAWFYSLLGCVRLFVQPSPIR